MRKESIPALTPPALGGHRPAAPTLCCIPSPNYKMGVMTVLVSSQGYKET